MSFLEIGGSRHPVPTGESVIGTGDSSFISLTGDGVASRHLVIVGTPDGQASVIRGDETAETFVNGVRLGPQPTPLLHGDKVEIGSVELLFVDERRSGSTQFVNAADLARLTAGTAAKKKTSKATGSTGGRLVSLTDGREYTILGTSPLVVGREAGCDVVVASKRASRRHCEITATPKGYVLIDTSTNGVVVNSDRVQGEKLLARADVIRIGEDEFRFYADTAPAEPEPAAAVASPPPLAADAPAPAPLNAAPAPAPPVSAPAPPLPAFVAPAQQPPPTAPPQPIPETSSPAPKPPPGAAYRLGDTMHGIPDGAGSANKSAAPTAPPVTSQPLRPTTPSQPAPSMGSPGPAAAPGASYRLGNTMHGIPDVPSPSKEPAAPSGAKYQLGDTMHGVPGAAGKVPAPSGDMRPGSEHMTQKSAPVPDAARGAGQRLRHTMHGLPASVPGDLKEAQEPAAFPRTGEREVGGREGPAAASGDEILASLLGRSGDYRGQRFPIRVPVVNIGRADYNDIVLMHGTVSTIHAKLQRREGIWTLIDLDSTNGTFVDGERIAGDTPIAPGAVLRFGEISMIFEPTDDSAGMDGGGSTKLMGAVHPLPGEQNLGAGGAPVDDKNMPGGRLSGPDLGRQDDQKGFRAWPFN